MREFRLYFSTSNAWHLYLHWITNYLSLRQYSLLFALLANSTHLQIILDIVVLLVHPQAQFWDCSGIQLWVTPCSYSQLHAAISALILGLPGDRASMTGSRLTQDLSMTLMLIDIRSRLKPAFSLPIPQFQVSSPLALTTLCIHLRNGDLELC